MVKPRNAHLILVLVILLLSCPSNASAKQPIKWADPSMIFNKLVVDAIVYTVEKYGANLDRNNYYAISEVSQDENNPYLWYATLLELSPDTDPHDWNYLEDFVNYYELRIVQNQTGFIAEFVQLEQRGFVALSAEMETLFNTEIPILPFKKNTYATYGVLGLHLYDAYGTNNYPGWYAVDFVSGPYMGDTGAPNAVYVSQSGVSRVMCRDTTQMGVKIGNYIYLHLVETGDIKGYQDYLQGDYLGSLVTGNTDTTCGVTSQSAENYHLHFGFEGTSFLVENYVYANEIFTDQRDGNTISATENIFAEWNSQLNPGALPDTGDNLGIHRGDNFWDSMVGGVRDMTGRLGSLFFPGAAHNLPINTIISIAALSVAVVWHVSLLNFELVMAVLLIILGLELIRVVLAGYKLIKSLIPFV